MMESKMFFRVLVIVALVLGLFGSHAGRDAMAQEEKEEKPKIKLAVMPLMAKGVTKDVAAGLTDIISVELSNRPQYQVITREDIVAMIGFEKDKMTLGCEDDTSCLAEIGGALGVDYIVTGSVTKVGNTFAVTISMINILETKVERRAHEAVGSVDFLPDAATRAVSQLVGEARAVVAMEGKGSLFVSTDPPGALVYLDGKQMRGETPLTLEAVTAGEHLVKVVKEKLERQTKVVIKPDMINKVAMVLAVVKAKFFSDPFDALVLIDGKEVGSTPLLVNEVTAGRHTIEIKKRGYLTYKTDVFFEIEKFREEGKPFEVTAEKLKPRPLDLEVKSVPAGAEVFLDGQSRGHAPIKLAGVMPGQHRLEVKLEGYRGFLKQWEVKPGDEISFKPQLGEFESHRRYVRQLESKRAWVRYSSYTAAGAAVLGALSMVVGQYIFIADSDREYDLYLSAPTPEEQESHFKTAQDRRNTGRNLLYIGYGLELVAAGAVGLGAYHYLTPPVKPSYKQEAAPVALVPLRGGGMIAFGGEF